MATITFNRPDVYNAFNNEMSFETQDALKSVSEDDDVRVLVITGAGKAFCSGQDLKATLESEQQSFTWALENRYNPIIRSMRQMSKPVIGRLNGIAAGAGCSIALACDMMVASDQASLIEVFVNIGLCWIRGRLISCPDWSARQKLLKCQRWVRRLKPMKH